MLISVSLVLFLSATLQSGVSGIQITDLRVPPAVKNNSGSAAVLDCEYTLKPDELSAEAYSGLVVKWYFNNSPSPVYQWIPGQKPQDLGILKGKLDLSHRASGHQATMHRALYIPNPTTDLSGDYKCLVSTFSDEDFMTKKMVVFAPEKKFHVTWARSVSGRVNVTCEAHGVFPEPKMTLFMDRSGLSDVRVKVRKRQQSYDIWASKLFADHEVHTTTMLYCELRIPEANYAVRRSVVYYPGIPHPVTDNSATNRHPSWLFQLLGLIVLGSISRNDG